MPYIHRMSRKYIPERFGFTAQNTKTLSKSHKLLLGEGLIRSQGGLIHLLPVIKRSVNKLQSIIHSYMESIYAEDNKLPHSIPAKLLEKTGRLNTPELICYKDRKDKKWVLGPTHEENITYFLASENPISHNKLPLRLYQISTKFRDEMRFKSGLLRSKEFIMKDLYCFDDSPESCEKTYKEVTDCYHRFFKFLKVPYVVVKGDAGDIGEGISHEFHFLSEVGDDHLLLCNDCGHGVNLIDENCELVCEKCKSNNVVKQRGIEVGHTFHLGKKYSGPLESYFRNAEAQLCNFEMSCYGLGITRIIAASVEVLSKPDQIRWPVPIAPYSVYFIPPKGGSKEETAAKNVTNHVYSIVNENFKSDVLVDDRLDMTLGKRLRHAKLLGIPYIVLVGKKIKDDIPKVEVQNLCDDSVSDVSVKELDDFIKNELLKEKKSEQEEKSYKAVI